MDLSLRPDPATMAAILTAKDQEPFLIPPHIALISEKLADAAFNPGRRVLIMCPPRTGKSLLTSVWFPLWYLSLFPNRQILFGSYGADFARKWGLAVLDKVLEYGDFLNLQLNPRARAADDWQLTAGGGMKTTGMDGSLTGRGGYLLVDDPVKDAAEAASMVMRDRAWSWWLRTAKTRLEPYGSAVVIQTRWHEDDLAGRLLERMKTGGEQWDVVNLPALAEEDDLLGRLVGESLWPERYSKETLLGIQKEDPAGFAALYQQRPTPAEGYTIKKEWFREYDPADLMLRDGPVTIGWNQLIQSWDMNLGAADSKISASDYCVGQVWGLFRANFYLLDQVRGRWDAKETLNEVRRLSVRWPGAKIKLIEKKVAGASTIALLRDEIPGLIPYVPRESKELRVKGIAYLIQSGNVLIPKGTNWIDGYLHEWASFPKGANDDQVDATTQALLYMEPKARSSVHSAQHKAQEGPPPRNLYELRERQVAKMLEVKPKGPTRYGDLRFRGH